MRTWFHAVQLVKYCDQTAASFALPTVCAANALFFGMWTARVSKNSPRSRTAAPAAVQLFSADEPRPSLTQLRSM